MGQVRRFGLFLLAFAVCGLLGGCGKQTAAPQTASAESLLGTWIAADLSQQPTSEVALRMQQGIAEGALRFEFKDAGRVEIAAGREAPQSGTWSVVSAKENQLVVRIASGGADAPAEAQYSIDFHDANRFTMRQVGEAGADELSYIFTRVRA